MFRQFVRSQFPRAAATVFSVLAFVVVSGESLAARAAQDVSKQPQLVSQRGHSQSIFRIACAPDGRSIYSSGFVKEAFSGPGFPTELYQWEVGTRRLLRSIKGHAGPIIAMSISPDGTMFASGSWDGTLMVRDVASGSVILLKKAVAPVAGLAFSMDGNGLIVASGGGVEYVNVATGEVETAYSKDVPSGLAYLSASRDGRLVAVGTEDDVRIIDLVSNNVLKVFPEAATSVAFSPDGKFLVTAAERGGVRVLNTTDYSERFNFSDQPGEVFGAAISPDGRLIAVIGHELWIRDANSGAVIQRIRGFVDRGDDDPVVGLSAVFCMDENHLLVGAFDGIPRIYRVTDGIETHRFHGDSHKYGAVSFDEDRASLKIQRMPDAVEAWNLATGSRDGQIALRHDEPVESLFSPDGLDLLVRQSGGNIAAINVQSGQHRWTYPENDPPKAQALSMAYRGRDSDQVLIGSGREHSFADLFVGIFGGDLSGIPSAVLWDLSQNKIIQKLEGHKKSVIAVAVSRNGEIAATGSAGFRRGGPAEDGLYRSEDVVRVWRLSDGTLLHQFDHETWRGISSNAVALSPDGRIVAMSGDDTAVRLYSVESGKELGRLITHADLPTESNGEDVRKDFSISSIRFSPDGELLLTSGMDNVVRIWAVRDSELLYELTAHEAPITGVAFRQDSRILATSSEDHRVLLWDMRNGKQLCSLQSFADGTWVVATPSGRFDTNNLDEIKGLHWVMPDDPLHTLTLEIFMRDYYEPRLLPRLLAGEALPEIRPLTDLNRVQPAVRITGIEREGQADTVAITVEVSGAEKDFLLNGENRRIATGVYDLRLFRDGQLVGQEPLEAGSAAVTEGDAEEELRRWRDERLVVGAREGKREIVFKGIRLPRRENVKEVQFSAYAFNEDRVKSETVRLPFAIPEELSPRVPRAYLVSVGVNAFEDRRWDLSYAANDAKALGEALKARLEAQHNEGGQPRYRDVVWLGLTSEAQVDKEGRRQITRSQASKAQIAAVLKTLAGQEVDADVLKGIGNAEKLRRANPEDLVIIALSSHGEVDERGRFYLLPQDIGSNASRQQRLERAISNDELSEWLRGLDATDLVMIVDACHSAASVQGEQFKPGPMGSKGLGQLAYDKGMRILAATQIDQYALETPRTQLGLLSYALVREGLEADKADYKPKDQAIWLSEWLSYASERVPGLYQDWREGKLKGTKRGEILTAPEEHPGETPSLQQPALFDFARNRDVPISQFAQ